MAGILPDPINGGVVIRNSNGVCQFPAQVTNAYCPPASFTSTCELTALPNDCLSRISVSQINGIVSELICLASSLNPTGSWNCAFNCNLSTNFMAWHASHNTMDGTTIIGNGSPANPYRVDPASLISTDTGNSLTVGTDDKLFVDKHLVDIITNPSGNVAYREVFSDGSTQDNNRNYQGIIQEFFFFVDTAAGSQLYSAVIAAQPTRNITLNNPYADRSVTAFVAGGVFLNSTSWNGTALSAYIYATVNSWTLQYNFVNGAFASSGGSMLNDVGVAIIPPGGSVSVAFKVTGPVTVDAMGSASGTIIQSLYTVKYVPFVV